MLKRNKVIRAALTATMFIGVVGCSRITNRISLIIDPPRPFVMPTVGPLERTKLGEWGPRIVLPHVPSSGANLISGHIVTWASFSPETFGLVNNPSTISTVFNPVDNSIINTPSTVQDMFCTGTTLLDDGRLYAAGGGNYLPEANKTTSFFDSNLKKWSLGDEMVNQRWYNTAVYLPSGQVFTAMGGDNTTSARIPEIWTPKLGWRSLPGIDFGYEGYYPWLHAAPNGKIFYSGPYQQMAMIDPNEQGRLQPVGNRGNDGPRIGFIAPVMYDEGKILVTGGMVNGVVVNTAMTIDFNGKEPIVTELAPMSFARTHHHGMPLPNGEVMIVGGNNTGKILNNEGGGNDAGRVLIPEIWNPTTGKWRQVAMMGVPRNYHSIALLLQDGRVFLAGGGLCGPGCQYNHPDLQIYSPGYLFNADGRPAQRPTIVAAPDEIDNGEKFRVETPDAINSFRMIRLSSDTHGINTDIRSISIPFTNTVGGYELTAQMNSNVLIPGYYWLFAVNKAGTPSIGKLMRVKTPTGKIDEVTPTKVRGWAYDAGATAQSIQVDIFVNGQKVDRVLANQPRADVNKDHNIIGDHGFEWAIPAQYQNTGAHQISVFANQASRNLTSQVIGSPRDIPQMNIAQAKVASNLTAYDAYTFANNAFDGKNTTRWASFAGNNTPQWIQVDLGAVYDINRIVLNWEAAYGRVYEIQLSEYNESNWKTVYSTSNGDGGIDDLTGLSGSGRYVRLIMSQGGPKPGYSLWEFEVYGTKKVP